MREGEWPEKIFEEIRYQTPIIRKDTLIQVHEVQSRPIQDKLKEEHAEAHIKQSEYIQWKKEKIAKKRGTGSAEIGKRVC